MTDNLHRWADDVIGMVRADVAAYTVHAVADWDDLDECVETNVYLEEAGVPMDEAATVQRVIELVDAQIRAGVLLEPGTTRLAADEEG